MKHVRLALVCVAAFAWLVASSAVAQEFDPELHAKAAAYQEFLDTHLITPLGAITGAASFTDATWTEMSCLHYQGDSMIWTGMYLGSQALRYRITGDEGARQNIIGQVQYLELAHQITQTPGYVPRFAGPDEPPWNCGVGDKTHGNGPQKVLGEGEWEGYYWIDETSRDQYSGYLFGLVQAYDAIDDEPTRETIRRHLTEVVEMLVNNHWNITDQNGEYTGNNAAYVGPVMRLGWLVIAAHVLDEPYYWELLDDQYRAMKPFLAFDTWSGYNRYREFFGNNLRHLTYQSIFRLWPDRARLQELWDIWQDWNRPWTRAILNPWFDAVHVTGCLRLGICNEEEMDQIIADNTRTLEKFWAAPNYRHLVNCSAQPLDPFSVWADEFLHNFPWLENLINIDPQTADARELDDRPWTDMYWQSGDCFAASCAGYEEQTFVGSGFDYLLAYWINVYYGLLPGDGPYGDDDLDDDDDDDTTDDDDDDDDDNDDNDNDNDDNDNDDTAPAADDDDDVGGCGC
jgi:hypothetical protein